MTNVYEKLSQTFVDKFNHTPSDKFFSPGRINLIGEHTDYNGGHVFPASITLGTYGVASARSDKQVKLYSTNFAEQGVISFDIDDETKIPNASWGNFVKGVLQAMKGYGNHFTYGFELVIEGDIPNGSGLSSSSSLELLIGVMAQKLYNLKIPRLQLVACGQRAENDFVGVNTGIMDQFAIGFGEKEHAIYLDTNTMIYEMVPIHLGEYVVVIMNTNKRRELAESKYNERVRETQEAVYQLQKHLNIQFLGELDAPTFEKYAHFITDETVVKRARHAVYENERTEAAVKALKANDLTAFGRLMNASHKSLKDDYEVTGIELDTLAETAQDISGVLGARMTGAGFGGCAITLVHQDSVDALEKIVGEKYESVMGYAPSFYVANIGKGAHWVGAIQEDK
ncbi:galactokinase [Leuconostoc gelidum subsp. aenigmaticum]|uniref:galactokinase n=1 Tax=Leuconostoc gelidum TaxID=1244 RepID=UPI001CC47C0C|nr:galactokinase [Leuconostoc gelidum]MBZ6003192.1 galactokinase [Leuconostoc gelidum subsp. aenigmaticum]